MAFGNLVTDFSQVAVGTYGYIIKNNLYPYFPRTVESVQVAREFAVSTLTPAPYTSNQPLQEINSYMEDSSSPDCAWHYANGILYIFFKSSVYPYDNSTRFAVFGRRNAQPLLDEISLCDIMDKDLPLLHLYMLEQAYQMKTGKAPYNIKKSIIEKEMEIKNES